MKCRLCNRKIDVVVLSIPKYPVGTFLKKEEIGKEMLKNLTIYYCDNCKSMQVKETISGKIIFSNYFYKTHAIETLKNHFYENAINFSKKVKNKKIKILEIGGNSCPFGEKLIKLGFKNFINFDPSNISLQHNPKGCKLINDFFTKSNVKKLLPNTKFDYIFSSNNFAHIKDIHDFIKGIVWISHKNTELTVEVQSLKYLVNSLCYPFFYHEHVYYYSEYSLIHLLEPYGFYLKDLNIIDIHGKSIQATFTRNKKNSNINLSNFISLNRHISLNYNVVLDFMNKMVEQKYHLLKFIKDNKNKKIAFYGASGQANMFLTYNFLGDDVSKYPLIDDAKIKHGLFLPKTHLKIYPKEYLESLKPDFIIVLAYHFYKEIIKKNKHLKTKWVIPLPEFKII